MNTFTVSGKVKRFPGTYGWYYVELSEALSKDLRPILQGLWPALLKASFSIHKTTWDSSIMPIKDGPLFIALPARVRKAEHIDVGQRVSITCTLNL